MIPGVEQQNPPETHPFWGYRDLLIFVFLAMPSLVAGALLVKVLLLLFHLHVHRRAAELLPAQFTGYGFLFLVLYLLFKARYQRPFWRSLNWVQPRVRLSSAFLLGLILALATALAGALLKTPDIETPLKELLTDRTSILLVGIFAVTLGPVCEELVFRGFLQPLLVRTFGAALGILVTALPFGLLHLQQYAWSWRHALLITLAGVAFGWMRYLSGSTLGSAVMHAAYNLTFFLALLSQERNVLAAW